MDWKSMESAPRNTKEVLLKVRGKGDHEYRQVAHFAQDLSGSEQPPFSGWFRDTGYGFAEIAGEPIAWAELPD